MSDAEILKAIGRNVAAARLRVGMTQECLAELAGVHFKTIGSIERGKYPFAVTTFVRLSQHLGVDAEELLAHVPEPDPAETNKTRKALARKRQ